MISSSKPFVSVIIPCRNEERLIEKCLDSLILQDYPKESLEILIVDGASDDHSKEIISKYCKRYSFFRLLDNPQKFTPSGLNIGIKAARGDMIIRMDSHASYSKDYISQCIRCFKEYGADNVGGPIETKASCDTFVAKSIAMVLSSSLGAVSRFRLGSKRAMEVDTVFGGCFKKEVFDRVGLFDERMVRSQDIEFNRRLKKAGGKIIMAPDIKATYYPQATLKGFFNHNFKDGFWVTYPLRFGIRYFSLRHLVPLVFVGALLGSLALGTFSFFGKLTFILIFWLYLSFIFFLSFKISLKNGFRYFPFLLLAVWNRHFAYGLGSLWGLVRIFYGR